MNNKKTKYFILITFFLTSTSTYTRWIKQSFFNKSKNCVIDIDKRASMQRLKSVLDSEVSESQTIFSTNRIVPLIVKEKRKIYVPSHFTKHLASYDLILLEKRSEKLFNSLSKKEYEEMVLKCKKEERKILFEDRYFLLMRGPFYQDCFSLFSSL
jgi:hypothetical protein